MTEKEWICDTCIHMWDCTLFITAFNGNFVITNCEQHLTKEGNRERLRAILGADMRGEE